MTAKSAFFNILQSLCVLCVYLGVCMCVRGQVFVHVDVSPHFAPCLRKDLLFAAASTRLAGLWVSEESPVFASHLVDKNVGLADMPVLPCLPSMSVLEISTQVATLVEQAFPTPHLSKPFLLYGKSISVNTMGRGGLRCYWDEAASTVEFGEHSPRSECSPVAAPSMGEHTIANACPRSEQCRHWTWWLSLCVGKEDLNKALWYIVS